MFSFLNQNQPKKITPMSKQRESISIDSTVSDQIREEAVKQRRSFSGMIEVILYDHLEKLKKLKKKK